jgi:hypothetical protein
MVKATRSDTFFSTRSRVAKRILTSSLAPFVGNEGDVNRHARLIDATLGRLPELVSTWSFLDATFRRAGTDCSLEVRCEYAGGRYAGEAEADAEGNEWTQFRVWCEVNFPCHGSSAPAAVLARCALYTEVAMLAAEIDAELGGQEVWRMTRTAAQAAEAKAKAEAEKVQQAVVRLLDANRKHMKVAAEKAFVVSSLGSLLTGVPTGTYQHEFNDGKRFTLHVTEGVGASMMRTA